MLYTQTSLRFGAWGGERGEGEREKGKGGEGVVGDVMGDRWLGEVV